MLLFWQWFLHICWTNISPVVCDIWRQAQYKSAYKWQAPWFTRKVEHKFRHMSRLVDLYAKSLDLSHDSYFSGLRTDLWLLVSLVSRVHKHPKLYLYLTFVVNPSWAPCWPHEPCYQGTGALIPCNTRSSTATVCQICGRNIVWGRSSTTSTDHVNQCWFQLIIFVRCE